MKKIFLLRKKKYAAFTLRETVFKPKELTLSLRNLIIKNKILILAIFYIGLISDIFFNPVISDLLITFLVGLWFINIYAFEIKPRQTFTLGVISYCLSFIAQFLGKEMMMEKGASWFLIFLVIALGQWLFLEFLKDEKKA